MVSGRQLRTRAKPVKPAGQAARELAGLGSGTPAQSLLSPHLRKTIFSTQTNGSSSEHSLLFIAGLIWNIFGFETNLKSKALFSGGVTPFLSNSTKVESALKQGSLKPAAALLLGFQLKIFLTEVFKILLKIL